MRFGWCMDGHHTSCPHTVPQQPRLGRKPLPSPSVRDGGGPVRVVTDQPDPDFKPRPVGFTAQLEPTERDNETAEETPAP